MILHSYFARRFVLNFLGVFGVLALFQGLLDLIEELRNLGDQSTFGRAVQLTLLKMPEAMYALLPLIMILATIALFLGLAKSSELVAARAAGRSGLTSLAAPLAMALLIGALIVSVLNPIVAATTKRYADLTEFYDSGNTSALSIGPEGLWLRQGGDTGQAVIRATRTNAEATQLFDVSIVAYAPDGGPASRIIAQEAELMEGEWQLRGVKSWPLAAGLNPESGALEQASLTLPSNLTRDSIRDRFGKPNAVAIWDLPQFIAGLELAGFSARRHTVWMHIELARPLFLMAMVLVGAAFTMRPTRSGGTGISVLSAVMLGFGLYYVRNFAQILGESGQLSPIIAAWTPPVAANLLALGLVLHMEDG
ncbi:LPS export ABC transporter permease LptG [Tropicibacter naphthalenivorans]|uniref:Lipopolysaccharide export system permease protein LptG n=1 Tax=Tropicibacter naphthalenivorans TaxID=441103 RepID=A0A0P1GW18_9RHOB|nr:LPS export ABC transporter permease LptG [Tropicibacter naphthalenivorans]CUH80146.1 Lipopolysaccharide export system permease protein LptG [Tropicibacter naphthalenivorans]SMC84858.1 lipopolysaccharide export system permease protein [Tropicibacter naphthalenivorans]